MAIKQLVNVSQVDTTPQNELGLEVDSPIGGSILTNRPGNKYAYVRASASITAGQVVAVTLDVAQLPGSLEVAPAAAVTTPIFGVAHVTIALNSYGFVTVHGVVTVNANAGIVAGTALGASAVAGQADTAAAANATALAAGRGLTALTATASSQVTAYLA